VHKRLAREHRQCAHRRSSVITSLPDVSEVEMTFERWKQWFREAAVAVLTRLPADGVAVFYQTDIKHEGEWIDKAYLCQRAAEDTGAILLWHKIVCRTPPGSKHFGRPAYSHMLCFSKGLKLEPHNLADVLPAMGATAWVRGMGAEAALFACNFIKRHTTTRTVVAPFCGMGTALAAANFVGLDAVGVELSIKRARQSQFTVMDEKHKVWDSRSWKYRSASGGANAGAPTAAEEGGAEEEQEVGASGDDVGGD
jgi:hypothetical protein